MVEILTDNYPGEITGSDANGQLLSGGPYGSTGTTYDTVCIDGADAYPCLQFVINDSYGDGICCGYGQGAYTLYLDGEAVATGGDYGQQDIVQLTARWVPMQRCRDPHGGGPGTVTQAGDNFWYSFTPPANAMYQFSAAVRRATRPCTSTSTATWATDDTNEGLFTTTTTRVVVARKRR